ncbi:MAG: hypothetical protein WA102_05580 [Candidatus Methanoperedens sp.]
MPIIVKDFIRKLIKYKSLEMNVENAKPKKKNLCGLCALCGEIAR